MSSPALPKIYYDVTKKYGVKLLVYYEMPDDIRAATTENASEKIQT